MRLGDDSGEDSGTVGEFGETEPGEVEEFSKAEELSGSPGRDPEKQGLMHTVLDADSDAIDLGNMVMHAVNNGVSMFTPEMAMSKLVNNFKEAERLYGETMIRQLTGYDARYVEKNVRIPEFRRLIEENIKQNIDGLKRDGVLGAQGAITDQALELATVVLAVQELEHLHARGVLGERVHRKRSVSGSREETTRYTDEPYHLLNVQQSIKVAVRRGHARLLADDLRAHRRAARGRTDVVYGIDVSGSMKGEKLAAAKRAGVALAYKAIRSGDKVGLVVFGKEVEARIAPTRSFDALLSRIARLRAGSETDLAASIRSGMRLFPASSDRQHMILLTDALPTVGADPDALVLQAASEAAAAQVSVSIVGIGLDERGEALARRIVDITHGRLLVVKDVDDLDIVVLEEYGRLA